MPPSQAAEQWCGLHLHSAVTWDMGKHMHFLLSFFSPHWHQWVPSLHVSWSPLLGLVFLHSWPRWMKDWELFWGLIVGKGGFLNVRNSAVYLRFSKNFFRTKMWPRNCLPNWSGKTVKLNKCISFFRCSEDDIETSLFKFIVSTTLRLGWLLNNLACYLVCSALRFPGTALFKGRAESIFLK